VCGCVLQELSAQHCYKILSQISDEDCRAMGFDTRYTRPDWMLVSVLPVPPPPVRPSVMMDSSARYALPSDACSAAVMPMDQFAFTHSSTAASGGFSCLTGVLA
jgi:hypothetical protein